MNISYHTNVDLATHATILLVHNYQNIKKQKKKKKTSGGM